MVGFQTVYAGIHDHVQNHQIRPVGPEIFDRLLMQVYDDNFSRDYGFWRPYVEKVIYRYLDCGDLKNGFARVRCKDCGHEYLLAFSCKRRHFCPSCHQKRVVEFGEWLCTDVLKKIPIGILSSASRRCCAVIFSMTESFLPA